MSEQTSQHDRPTLRTWFRSALSSRALELRRRRRTIATVAGHTIRVLGLVIGGGVFYFGLGFIILMVSPHGSAVLSLLPTGLVEAVVAVPIAMVLLGTVLVAGRKRTILFLRRFGDQKISESIRQSLEGFLHSNYRLVALDDSTLSSIGVPKRRFRRTVTVIALATIGILFAAGCLLVLGKYTPDNFFGWEIAAALTMLIPAGGLALLALPTIYFARGTVKRAAHVLVRDERELALAVRRVRRQRRWLNSLSITAPQALILNTYDDLWQATVLALLPIVDVVIVDLSCPTDNIEWEIENVFAHYANKCIVLGAGAAMVSNLQQPPNDAAMRIMQRVRGATLLVYEDDRSLDADAMLTALDAAGSRNDSPTDEHGRVIIAAVGAEEADAWNPRTLRTFLDHPGSPSLIVTPTRSEDVDARVALLREEYPRLEVEDLRGRGNADRVVLIPSWDNPRVRLEARRKQVLRCVRMASIGLAAIVAMLFTGWSLYVQKREIEFHKLVYKGQSCLDRDAYQAGRLAIAAITKKDGYEAYELLLEALEKTRPFVKLPTTEGWGKLRHDGTIALTVCDEGVCLWGVEGGLIRTLGQREMRIHAADWHPDGQHVVTVGGDGRARLWSIEGSLELQDDSATASSSVAISPDGRYAALVDSESGTLQFWQLQTNENTVAEAGNKVMSVAWFPTSEGLAAVTVPGELVLLRPNQRNAERRTVIESPRSVSISPDGRFVVVESYSRSGPILVDSQTWEAHALHLADSARTTWHPREPWFVSSSVGYRSFSAFLPDGVELRRIQGTWAPRAFGFDRLGDRMAVAGEWTQLYQLPSWELLLSLGKVTDGSFDRIELTPAGEHALATGEGEALLWDLRPQPPRRLREVPRGEIRSFAWNADGSRATVLHEDNVLFEYDRDGNLRRRVDAPDLFWQGVKVRYVAGEALVLANDFHVWWLDPGSSTVQTTPIADTFRVVGVSPSGSTIGCWSTTKKELRLQNRQGEVLLTVPTEREWPSITWNRSEDLMVVSWHDDVEMMWRDNRRQPIAIKVTGAAAFVDSAETRLAVASERSAALYGLDGEELRHIELSKAGEENQALVKWSPDTKWLVRVTDMGWVQIYSDNGTLVLEDRGSGGSVPYVPTMCLAWTPDSGRLYIDHQRGGPWIWRPGDSALTKLMETRPFAAMDAAFTPDGTLLLVSTGDGIEIWPSKPLLEVAKRRLGFLEPEDLDNVER